MHSVAAESKLSSEKIATAADLVDAGLRDELANRVTNFGNAAKRTTERVKTHNWRTPKAQKLTYAQQCVQAYKRRCSRGTPVRQPTVQDSRPCHGCNTTAPGGRSAFRATRRDSEGPRPDPIKVPCTRHDGMRTNKRAGPRRRINGCTAAVAARV